ncbi:hypothetical protein F2Q68_00004065 [Brassica cretica]|uniref:Uncharacterized protein n=1 Tax=Brassica cretica TaxID=69181 RepID=A0A8S9J859_BRACR|nr:hypothetical protein F2Q68_00004065 [Brassica cretica]
MARLTLALDMLADVPQSKDHYMEPAQHARLEKDHARLEKDHARLNLDHEVSQNDRDFSLLARLARTASEPSLFISKKSKGKSETHVEELKDFSDSLPIYDEYDEEPIESLMICEKNCDFPSSESERMIDNEQAIGELTVLQPEHPSSLVLSPQVFEEEPLDYPHQGPRLDSRKPLDEDLGPIFDEEDEPGPVFDAETTSITSIVMESHLCFDPGTTHIPLTPDLQEHLFVLSIQEIQVQPLRNDSINHVQQLEIWRSFVVQPGYLGDASDRGSVKNGYLNIQDVFCHEFNFHGDPTHQGFTEAWNHLKIFTEEGVMNFSNRRFYSPSIREYQTSKGDSGPRKKRPEPKPILNEPKMFPHFTVWPDFEIDKPIFGNHFTCFILAHVLDDYPKGLDPDFDVLRIEKPFDYFFHRFDVVSLVVLNEQDKHDQFPRRASTGTMDLRTNPFEEGGNDVPQSKDHYMEPAQHEVQDVLSISTEVHVFHHARLEKDHARLEKDHARLGKDHARLDLDHEVSQNDRDFSLLARLARTACTNDRVDDLSTLFDPIMDFSFGNFSKARILKLSEDLGFVGTQLVRSERPAALADRPA